MNTFEVDALVVVYDFEAKKVKRSVQIPNSCYGIKENKFEP